MARTALTVIGNGMAAGRFLEELLPIAGSRYGIDVFGAEPHGTYNRVMLSPVLSGEMGLPEIMIHDRDWFRDNGITLHSDCRIEAIDTRRKCIRSAAGRIHEYDRLVIATGSSPVRLALPGSDLPGVISFREIRDVEMMLDSASRGERAVVIGGGLLGLEAASGLVKQGMGVTVVQRSGALMNRQLDAPAAAYLLRQLRREGLEFRLGLETRAFLGKGCVSAVSLADGSELEADLVVVAAGIQPNRALAKAAGIACGRGILVDDRLRTSVADVYALGECVEHRGRTYGLVAPLYEMATACARQLAGVDDRYVGSVSPTRLKVTGIELFSMGAFAPGAGESLVLEDPRGDIYRRLIVADGRLSGAVLYGDTGLSAWYEDLINSGERITAIRDRLMFGPPNAPGLTKEQQQAA